MLAALLGAAFGLVLPWLTAAPNAAGALPPIKHVFIVMLENESSDVTFGPQTPAPYLARELTAQGAYLQNYFGIGHNSLDNYIALISGQAPNPATQMDCQTYADFTSTGMTADGQAIGRGCIYPASVPDLADALIAKGLTWRSYNEDMGNDPTRESATCGHPPVGAPDSTQRAQAPSASVPLGDQYATRHNPFMYFHAIIDAPSCMQRVVNLSPLKGDLAAYESTANLTFITPNLCNDGHDAHCVAGPPGGLVAADAWLRQWIPVVLGSSAYKRDGLLLVLFDESDVEGKFDKSLGKYVLTGGDARACCGEQSGPNVIQAGQIGPGGGQTGAVALSPFIKPGTVSQQPYNHYSTLRTIEDIFGLTRLGYSAASDLAPFGADIFAR